MRGLPRVALVLLAASCGHPPAPVDWSPPGVRFTTPASAERVHETITVGVRAEDPGGNVRRIALFLNGEPLATGESASLSLKWDTRTVPRGGPALLEAVATDAAGLNSRDEVHVVIDRGGLPAEKENIYSLMNEGSLDRADALLRDVWDLGPRSQPVHIAPITWREDPLDRYWRFLFYGLRPLAELTWAYYTMGDTRYRDKLLEILASFLDHDERRSGLEEETLDDKHSSAYRAMALVNAWGRLSRSGDLSPGLAARLRAAALRLAGFLANPTSFQGDYNHGFTEAAALLVVAVNFPDAASATRWQATAIARLERLMENAVDGDGVEIEKSPFYHFYVMNFANEIAAWAEQFGIPLGPTFAARAQRMTTYAAYVTHPSGEVPLIGASVTLNARRQARGSSERLGRLDPAFEFVRTGGAAGTAPAERNRLFSSSGHSIMRSGFGRAGDEFDAQTHVVFNVGPYRTAHSHLDGLSLVYASSGRTLLTDSGLFAYEDAPGNDYFRSTRAHNTVVVDGRDQNPGAEHAGATLMGAGWSYQSGSHGLYPDVLHRRAVLLLERDLLLVVDVLAGTEAHDFAQTWHFLPEARVSATPSGATGRDDAGTALISVQQGLDQGARLRVSSVRGATDPVQGWLSPTYGVKVDNAAVAFHQEGAEAAFATLVASGSHAAAAPAIHAIRRGDAFAIEICRESAAMLVALADIAGPTETVQVELDAVCGGP